MDKVTDSLKIITLVIGLLVPLILLTGYVYHLGYIHAFGLDFSLVSKDLSEMLVESWYLALLAVDKLLPVFTILMVLILISMVVLHYKRNRKETNGNNKNEEAGREENTDDMDILFVCLMMPVVLIIAYIVISVKPYQVGREDALKQIQDHHQYSCAEIEKLNNITLCSQLIDMSDNNNIISQGIMVTSNDKRIAIYSNNKVEVFPFLPQYKLSKTSKQPLIETEQKD